MSKLRQICPICAACNTKQKDGYYMCCACRHKWRDVESSSVFDRITESPEVLAEKLVYCDVYYKSTIIPGESWEYEQEAIAATVAKLKEVDNGEKDNLHL